ncbi:selenide, water dikinase SelD [Cyclobacterium qasimii]|uniref:Selenide, water dikinase n=2 Tax=Cyclobacterium qasimii TaxID=1350429 RepID=S7VHM1_9BACT|nr:selenide, water dikinase SelD [Cyclobacterium qasimii]EPR69496.1 Selenide,water dikinase [Cyclobacterium qasimii M12-11B]GEO21356.1 selenide, water dikinase [Cyclobacterium qasimii]
MENQEIKLTKYSHGAGCGCKISPAVLSEILQSEDSGKVSFPNLLVGNEESDDAAVISLDGETAIVSTTDFFMPIVDDPFDFGAIAATNALSDIYAMGAKPLMAIAILGWPISKLPAAVASKVLEGGRSVCHKAGIPLAGGHSIDAPEPIFGLAVTGSIAVNQVKRNSTAKVGDRLYLTKPIGVGMVTTAEKKELADKADVLLAKTSMLKLNDIGALAAGWSEVHAMTDVTGFGLGGHLTEMCKGASFSAQLELDKIPCFGFVQKYIDLDCIPGGTHRNWDSYGNGIVITSDRDKLILADPQTSGGLLMAVDPNKTDLFERKMKEEGYSLVSFGEIIPKKDKIIYIN